MQENREYRQRAVQNLKQAPQAKKIALYYAALICAVNLLVLAADLLINNMTPQTGGLATMGTRSFFSALSGILPVVSSVLSMCLGFGYLGGMVRISRGQYASVNCLRTGFERFWPLLRLTVLKALILMGLSVGACYLATTLFTLSPFSDSMLELLTPLVSGGSLLNEGTVPTLDAATASAVYASAIPLFVILAIVFAAFVVPLLYRLRMADYVLYDHPETGALYAIRESKKIMRNNRFKLFRLDVSFWWYYLATGASAFLVYGDLLLPLIGIRLPLSGMVSSIVFYLLSVAADLAVVYFLRSKTEVAYAMMYNDCKPKEENTGVVLGNIFQM